MPDRLMTLGLSLLETAPSRRSKVRALVASAVLLLLIGVTDYFAGYEIQLSVVYLVPIFVATSKVGRLAGMAVAVLSAASGIVGDLLAGQLYTTWLVPATVLVLRSALFLVFVLIVTALRHALDREKESARTDPLTGLSNRRHFVELVAPDLFLARRYRRPLTIAYLDLDNFKQVNDRLGHRAGDELLRLVAGTLRSRLRVTDALGRLGGDEFAICLPETGAEAATVVLAKLREDVAAVLPEECRFVTLSVGMVTFAYPPASVDELLERTDFVLYAAKREGKNRLIHEVIPA